MRENVELLGGIASLLLAHRALESFDGRRGPFGSWVEVTSGSNTAQRYFEKQWKIEKI